MKMYDKKDALVQAVAHVLCGGIMEAKGVAEPQGELSQWEINHRTSLEKIRNGHKQLLEKGYKYIGSEGRPTPLGGHETVHHYAGDGHTVHMQYDSNSLGCNGGCTIKHTKTEHQIGVHHHLREDVIATHPHLVEKAVAVHTIKNDRGETKHVVLDNGKKVASGATLDDASDKANKLNKGAPPKVRQPEAKTSQSTHIHQVHTKPYGVKPGEKDKHITEETIPTLTADRKTIPASPDDAAREHNSEMKKVFRNYLAGKVTTQAEIEHPVRKRPTTVSTDVLSGKKSGTPGSNLSVSEGKIDDLRDKMAAKKRDKDLDDYGHAPSTPAKKTLATVRKVAGKSYGSQKEPEQKDEEVVQDQNLEQLDELSKKTLATYVKKASSSSHPNSAPNLASRAAYALGSDKGDEGSNAGEKDDMKSFKRSKNIGKAVDKITKEDADILGEKMSKDEKAKAMKKNLKKWPMPSKKLKVEGAIDEAAIGHIKKGGFHSWLGKSPDAPITAADIKKGLAAGGHAAKMANFARNAKKFHHEEVTIEETCDLLEDVELNEKITKATSAGDVIHDFVHSNNPKFSGKSPEKRKQMALAAYYAKHEEATLSFTNKLLEDFAKKGSPQVDGIGDHAAEEPSNNPPKPKSLARPGVNIVERMKKLIKKEEFILEKDVVRRPTDAEYNHAASYVKAKGRQLHSIGVHKDTGMIHIAHAPVGDSDMIHMHHEKIHGLKEEKDLGTHPDDKKDEKEDQKLVKKMVKKDCLKDNEKKDE